MGLKLMKTLYLIKSDLVRYSGRNKGFIKQLLINRGFRILFLFRLGNSIKFKPLFFLYKIFYQHFQNKYSIDLPLSVKLGYGIYIGHSFAIAINKKCQIGNNVNISQCVTLGIKQTGNNMGVPIIGNNVYIGPGAKIIGSIRINDNSVVGANAVVTKDVPENAVVVGVPAKIISYDGSFGLVNNKFNG